MKRQGFPGRVHVALPEVERHALDRRVPTWRARRSRRRSLPAAARGATPGGPPPRAPRPRRSAPPRLPARPGRRHAGGSGCPRTGRDAAIASKSMPGEVRLEEEVGGRRVDRETPAVALAGGLVIRDAAVGERDQLRDAVDRSERPRTRPVATLGDLQVVESVRVDEQRARRDGRGCRRQDDRHELEVARIIGRRGDVSDPSGARRPAGAGSAAGLPGSGTRHVRRFVGHDHHPDVEDRRVG